MEANANIGPSNLLPNSISKELRLFPNLPKCTALDPPTSQPFFKLLDPCTMPQDGRKCRLQPISIRIPDAPFKLVNADCCPGKHYGKVRVLLVYPNGLKFTAFLTNSCIARLLCLDAEDYHRDDMATAEIEEMARLRNTALYLVCKSRNPKILASYRHKKIYVSAISLSKSL